MSTTLSDSCKEPDLLLSPTSTLCQSPTAFTGSGMFTFPRLEISSLDTSPFSNSFSGLIKEELITWRQDANAANDQDTSYDIERFTNMKELVPEWDDEDVDEILIMCPKSDRQLTPIEEEPARPDVPQSISLTDFIALPDYLQGSQGPPLYRKHDTGRLYVLKSFPSRASKPACERDVLEILGDVKAPFLPRICWSFWDDDSFCMVLEYYSQETIADIVRSGGALKPERAHFFACEIIQALTSLHATGIVHRDLRPENIIIDNAGHVVVDGFGSSELLPPSSKARGQGRVFCMTAASTVSVFCAPEMLLGWSHDYVVDTWGFGVLLLFMVSGRYIFGDCDTSPDGWREMIVKSPIVLPLFLASAAHDLISKCLERNPMARLSLSHIKKHTYFYAVDWKKVSGKRIRAPCPLQNTVDQNRNQFRTRLDKVVSSIPRTCSWHSRTMSHVGSTGRDPKTSSENDFSSPDSEELPQGLPPISRMSSLLVDLPETAEPAISPPDPPVYSALTLNNSDTSSNPLRLNVNPQDHMTSFWESLDAEVALKMPSLSPEHADAALRPRKLRKARSSIYPEHRVSTLSTLSLQNLTRFRKLGRSTSTLPRPSKILDLPEGVKQIGGGIGFKYNVPVAAKSKASICTNTPQACHGLFHGRLHGLGLGLLRSPTATAKVKARRTLMSLVIPERRSDERSFPTEFRGSTWSLVVPLLPDGKGLESTGAATASSSPISGADPVTPATLVCDAATVTTEDEEGLDSESVAPQTGSGDVQMTLRLVVPTGVNTEAC